MACFPDGFFKDPAKDKTHLIELVANYARNVPELLPALRDVINYGMLYDQKLKAFLDLLNQERKRQKSLSAGGSSQTDYVENDENIRIRSTETPMEEGSLVKKKKKKKKKHEEEAREETETDETVIDQTAVGHTENAENVCPNEEGPPVKKKKNKNKKAQTRDYDSSASADSQPLQENGHSEVSSVAGGRSSSADEVKPKNEVKGEEPKHEVKEEDEPDVTTIDENVLINTVVGDQSETCYTSFSVSKSENTPRKRNILDSETGPSASTPFRVIPSVQLMEDPARFPDLAPTPAETTQTETSSEPMKKWRVLFEFDCRLVGSSWTLTAAEVRTALEKFGLRNIQVLQLEMTEIGTYFVKVECFSADFHSVFSKQNQPSVNGVPGRVTHSEEIASGNPPKKCNDVALPPTPSSSIYSSLGNPLRYDDMESNSRMNSSGCPNPGTTTPQALDSEVRTDNLPSQGRPTGYGNHESNNPQNSAESDTATSEISDNAGSSINITNMHNSGRFDRKTRNPLVRREFHKQLLNTADVRWAMARSCNTREKLELFKEWLKIQRASLPDSLQDDGNVLFKPPVFWVKGFEEWVNQTHGHEIDDENKKPQSREGASTSQQAGPSTSRHARPSTPRQARHDSSARPPGDVVQAPSDHTRYYDRRISQLLYDQGDYKDRPFLRHKFVSDAMDQYLEDQDRADFLRWMAARKKEIFRSSARDKRNVLFFPRYVWFKEFRKWKNKNSGTEGKGHRPPPRVRRRREHRRRIARAGCAMGRRDHDGSDPYPGHRMTYRFRRIVEGNSRDVAD